MGRGSSLVCVLFGLILLQFVTNSFEQETLYWEHVIPNGTTPHARWLPSSTVRAGSNRWTIISGEKHADAHDEEENFRDYWEYDFINNYWTSHPEIADQSFVAKIWRKALFTRSSDLVLWAGKGNAETDAIHLHNQNSGWTVQRAEFPQRVLRGYAALLYGTTEKLYIFGGVNENVQAFGAAGFWSYTFPHTIGTVNYPGFWQSLHINVPLGSSLPGARYFHSGVFRSEDTSWYIFGGTKNLNLGEVYNDIWKYSFAQNVWEQVETQGSCAPQARCLHTAVATPDGMGMYIYGGVNYGMVSQSDLWLFHFKTSTWHQIRTGGWDGHDAPRDGHAMALWRDTRNQNLWIYIYGGDTTSREAHTWGDIHRAEIGHSGCTVSTAETCRYTLQESCYEKGGIVSDKLPAFIVFLFVLAAVVTAVGVIGGRYVHKNYKIVDGQIKYQPSTSVLPTPSGSPGQSDDEEDHSHNKKKDTHRHV